MLFLMKCPGHQKKGKKKASQNPDFLLFFLCFSCFVWAGLKLLECVSDPCELSSFSTLLQCVCQWAELPVCPLSLPLRVWMLERCVASLLSSCVWLPLLWPPPSFRCLSLSLLSVYQWFAGYLEFVWGDWILSFLSPYLSAVVPQMSSLSVIGRLLKPLGFEGLCAFMCLCGRGEQGVGCSVPPCFRLPFLSPISLSPPLPRPLAERSRSERRKESRSSLPLPGF